MLIRDIGDKLLNQHRLTNTGAAEQTDLTTSLIRAEQVNDLDACLEHFCRCRLFLK